MNIKDRMILDEYKREKPNFIKLEQVVDKMLHDMVAESGVMVAGVEHRVKGEKSLEGKLYKNGDWYQKLDDLTDLLGARIICYFGDDVDKVGKLIEKMFEIDWENSSDKRALIKADTFGYLSLHYICSLPEGKGYPDEICGKRFE
ncbi:MAG: RelA/SpoT domain-containing protein, partial [Acutalibacteraceae bacterium]